MKLISGVYLKEQGDNVIRAANHKWGGGIFEPESLAAWRSHLYAGAVAVDVGAYTGIYTIAAAQVGARVYAIEPNETAMERLRDNVALNGIPTTQISVFNGAAGAEVGNGTLEAGSSMSSAATVRIGGGPIEIQTIDNVLAGESAPISAIKIDAERSEPQVLQGAEKTIKEHKPLLIIETLGEDEARDIIGIVEPWGYCLCDITKTDGRNLVCR